MVRIRVNQGLTRRTVKETLKRKIVSEQTATTINPNPFLTTFRVTTQGQITCSTP